MYMYARCRICPPHAGPLGRREHTEEWTAGQEWHVRGYWRSAWLYYNYVIIMQLLTRMAMDSSTYFQAPPQAAYFL